MSDYRIGFDAGQRVAAGGRASIIGRDIHRVSPFLLNATPLSIEYRNPRGQQWLEIAWYEGYQGFLNGLGEEAGKSVKIDSASWIGEPVPVSPDGTIDLASPAVLHQLDGIASRNPRHVSIHDFWPIPTWVLYRIWLQNDRLQHLFNPLLVRDLDVQAARTRGVLNSAVGTNLTRYLLRSL